MHYDVVIIGGGLTGTLIAHVFSDLPYRILWVAPEWEPPIGSMRRLGLTARTLGLLKGWGIEPQVTPVELLSVVMNRHRLMTLQHDRPLGGHVCWKDLHGSLSSSRLTQVQREKTVATSFLHEPDRVVIELKNNKTVSASLVIGADGKDSLVRKMLMEGEFSYEVTGQSAHTLLLEHHCVLGKAHAYQIGWHECLLGVLPLGGGRSLGVLTAPISIIQEIKSEELLGFVSTLLPSELLPLRSVQKIGDASLLQGASPNQIGKRVLLLGEAAKIWHPAAAMGFNHTIFELSVLKNLWTMTPPEDIRGWAQQFKQAIEPRVNQLRFLTQMLSHPSSRKYLSYWSIQSKQLEREITAYLT